MKRVLLLSLSLSQGLLCRAQVSPPLSAPILMPQKLQLACQGEGPPQLHWRAGSGTHRVVFMREANPATAPLTLPVDGRFYKAFMGGATFVASAGLYANGLYFEPAQDTVVALPQLLPGHQYEAAVFDYYVDPVRGPLYQPQTLARLTFTAPWPTYSCRLFPNPARAQQMVSIEGKERATACQISVIDMRGRLCFRQLLPPLSAGLQLPAALKPGSYAVEVETNGHKYAARLLIVE